MPRFANGEPERMAERPKSRRLTVSSCHAESRAVGPRYLPITPMPFLRLRGRWLDQAGFAIGTNVRVEVSAGRLVVAVVESERAQDRR
jgi:toxic protein SymE